MENIDIDIDIDKDNLKNIDIDIDIDMAILENIDIDIDIDKGILQNIDIDKISYRLGFGISNTPTCDKNCAIFQHNNSVYAFWILDGSILFSGVFLLCQYLFDFIKTGQIMRQSIQIFVIIGAVFWDI